MPWAEVEPEASRGGEAGLPWAELERSVPRVEDAPVGGGFGFDFDASGGGFTSGFGSGLAFDLTAVLADEASHGLRGVG